MSAKNSSNDSLGKLFGSPARIKLMRLFLFNAEEPFTKSIVAKRLRIPAASAGKELALLMRAGFIKKKIFTTETRRVVRGKPVRKKVSGCVLNAQFPFLEPLRMFLLETALQSKEDVVSKIRPVGRLRLVIISGIFTGMWDARLDLLIVGEAIKEQALQNAIKSIEAEIGRELRYAILSTRDFYYRRSIQDRLIRDVIDFPHERVIDRLGVF